MNGILRNCTVFHPGPFRHKDISLESLDVKCVLSVDNVIKLTFTDYTAALKCLQTHDDTYV